MSTPAVRALESAGVAHLIHDYVVDEAVGEGYGEAVAAAIGAPPERVFKTLMAVVDGRHVVAVIPVANRLSMKKLAAAAGGRKAEMAPTRDAERLTGYVSGGISPIGQRRSHPTYLDQSAALGERIYVSAGRRGLQVELGVADLVAMTGAITVDLA